MPRKATRKEKNDFEIFCYETDEGSICLEFDEVALSFSKERFLEFTSNLNEVCQLILLEYARQGESQNPVVSQNYRI